LCSRDPAPTLDCPGGSCEGKDLDETVATFDKNDCHCQCIDEAAGDPSPAGALRCRLPIGIRVEANPPCNDVDTLVRLPPLCAPLTTGTHNGVISNANEDAAASVEVAQLDGVPRSCEQVDSGSLTGMRIVTNLGFFDSTVGDLISQLVVTCE
jgi:hypothetical protein